MIVRELMKLIINTNINITLHTRRKLYIYIYLFIYKRKDIKTQESRREQQGNGTMSTDRE